MLKDSDSRIVIFGGTFAPFHIGHMALANLIYYRTPFSLSKIYFVPTIQNPLKAKQSFLPFEMRCRLIEQTIYGDSRFFCSRMEETLPAPHYTIDLLNTYSTIQPNTSFLLLIGADNWATFKQWYHYEEILNKYEILIYPRRGYKVDKKNLSPSVYYLEDLPYIEVSSTEIRKALLEGQDLRYLLPRPDLYPLLRAQILRTAHKNS